MLNEERSETLIKRRYAFIISHLIFRDKTLVEELKIIFLHKNIFYKMFSKR